MPVSATLAANDTIAHRRANGLPVVPLGFGEAGLPVHPLLTAALADAAGSAGYGPVAGIPALLEAAAGYWSRRGVPTEASQVVAGPGSKPLLWAILGARGGGVALPKPSWVSYAAQAAMQGLDTIRIRSVGGVPDPSELDAVARGLKLSTVVVTLPDNPTGRLAPPSVIRDLCAVAERHDLLIVSDEIYRDLTSADFLSPASVSPDRVVVTSGLSKNLALGGWRLGVARFADPHLRSRVVDFASEVWSAPSRPVQHAAAVAFAEPPALVERVAQSRNLHLRVASAVASLFGTPPPDGAFYLYPHVPGFATDRDVAAHLLSRNGVVVLPGSSFGDDPSACMIRVATSQLYGDTDEQKEQALRSDNPAELPWIVAQLELIRNALA
ncbi:pyridoxal phosphate-dependent aminotransferase [Kutzneria kofuensis]|uniref:Aminotransferase n=1 Tax=Kutzneria kofuensis TaxID=103725 RepID=A0A7W9NED7_9PSEU|nr:pyridoxal phosphate-dependent aminotransferase [Kutzneria kofuensis]MBB5889026.1 aspartate/methionine/tyrosine aminotransferase [Kutzneria kofuensis]